MSAEQLIYMVLVYALVRVGQPMGTLSRARLMACVDVLFINWVAGCALFLAHGRFNHLPSAITVEFLSAIWLVAMIGTALARRLALFHLALMVAGMTIYVLGDPAPPWKMAVMNAISWGQMVVLIWGARGDGMGQAVDRAVRDLRGGGRAVADASRSNQEQG